MKKVILALLIFGAVACAPIAKADEVMLGDAYTTQIAPMEQIAELQAKLISLITQLIGILQEQLNTINAQNAQNQVASNPTPAPQAAPVQGQAPAQTTMEPFNFTPEVLNTGSDLVVIIKEKFDTANLIITDANGNKVREQSNWMTDSQGNSRQVYTMSDNKQKYSYSITCSKAGFETATKTGDFPTNQ